MNKQIEKEVYEIFCSIYESGLLKIKRINDILQYGMELEVTDNVKNLKQLKHECKSIKLEYDEGLKFWKSKLDKLNNEIKIS